MGSTRTNANAWNDTNSGSAPTSPKYHPHHPPGQMSAPTSPQYSPTQPDSPAWTPTSPKYILIIHLDKCLLQLPHNIVQHNLIHLHGHLIMEINKKEVTESDEEDLFKEDLINELETSIHQMELVKMTIKIYR